MTTSPRLPALGAALALAAFLALTQFGAPLASADDAQPNAEPVYLKDLDIRQVPMADLAPIPASRPESEAPGLSVRTAVDRSDGRYSHGDSLVITVEVSEDAYVWVFDTGTSGKVHQIYPNRYESDNSVLAGNPVAIPRQGADYQFVVSHPKGAELLTVIASKDGAPLAQDLIDQETQAGPFLALRGDAASVAKDLSISLKKAHSHWVGQHQVIHIE